VHYKSAELALQEHFIISAEVPRSIGFLSPHWTKPDFTNVPNVLLSMFYLDLLGSEI
jgi:hypothetical protein